MRRVSSMVGSRNLHAAEAARERLVFLDVLLVFAERGRGNHADLAARQHRLEHVGGVRRRAERRAGADHRVRLVDEQDEVRPLLQLADDVLDAVLEHAAQHRAGDHGVHLQVHELAVAQPHRHRVGLELDASRQTFDDGGLADAGLAEQHDRVGALAVAEDFEHLLDFVVASEDRRQLVLPREQVQVGGEVLQERRQLEPLLQPLLAQLEVAHARVQARDEHVGLDAVAPQDRDRHALRFLEQRREQVDGFNGLPAGPAGVVQRELEDELRRRRHAKIAAGKRRHHLQVLFDGLQDRVRVQLDVAHDFGEGVPLHLREGEKNMFVRQQRMVAAARFLERAIDDPLRRFRDLARRDVEIFHVHVGSSDARHEQAARQAEGGWVSQARRRCGVKNLPQLSTIRKARRPSRPPLHQAAMLQIVRAASAARFEQRSNPLFGRRVRAEERPNAAQRERLDDEHVRGRRVRIERHALATPLSIFRSALTRPCGLPAIAAPPASASNSRDREIAAWISIAAIGARIIIASSAIGFCPSRSSLRPPPKNIAKRATIMIAAASVAATELMRMSRCLTCASSCAMTPVELVVGQDAAGCLRSRRRRRAAGCGRSRTRSARRPE